MKVKKSTIATLLLYITVLSYIIDIGNTKYIVAYLCMCIYGVFWIGNEKYDYKLVQFAEEFKNIFSGLVVLMVITFSLQIIHGFNVYGVQEIIYFVTPLFMVALYLQLVTEKMVERTISRFFIIYIVAFLVRFRGTISISGILSISFMDSYSPYECGLALMCVLFTFYFMIQKKIKMQIVCLILSYITLKRFSFVMELVLLVISILNRRTDINHKRINKVVKNITIVCFILLPIITRVLLSDTFSDFFYKLSGLNIDNFTMGRFERLQLVTNAKDIVYGLGSTTVFLTKYFIKYYNSMQGTIHTNFNLHNDIYRIYIECGILGTCAFTIGYFKSFQRNIISYLIITYLFLEMNVNHLLGAGTVDYWIVAYLILWYSNKRYGDSNFEKHKS